MDKWEYYVIGQNNDGWPPNALQIQERGMLVTNTQKQTYGVPDVNRSKKFLKFS